MKKLMNKINIKNLLICIAALLVLIGGALLIKNTLSSNTDPAYQDAIVDNLKLTNIDITTENKVTTYKATVTSDKDEFVNSITMTLKDKDGKVIVKLLGYIGRELKQNEGVVITARTDADLSNLYSIEYSKK